MRAHHAGSQLAGHERLGSRNLVARRRFVDAVRPAQEALARHRHHHWVAQTHELLEVAHQLQRLRRRLAEAGTGVDADAVVRDARSLQSGSPVAQPLAHVGHHVVIRRRVLHGRGVALHVHDHQPAIAVAHRIHHDGVAEAGHVVHDGRARFQARARNFGVARIDAHAHIALRQCAHHRQHARQLLVHGHRRGAGRVDSPPTSIMRASLLRHALGMSQRGIEAVVLASVGEGVGG